MRDANPVVCRLCCLPWGAGAGGKRLTKREEHLRPRRLHISIVDEIYQLLDWDGTGLDCFCEDKALVDGGRCQC